MKRTFAFLILTLCVLAFMLISCEKSYSITYELDGGTNSENNPVKYQDGDTFALDVPTREGYMFAGWYTEPEFENIIMELTDVNKDITLYAKWIELDRVLVFKQDGDSYTVYDCYDNVNFIAIPSTYNGLPVTKIGRSAFEDCRGIVYVHMPDSITTVAGWAFEGCEYLQEIRLSNNLTSIMGGTFSHCNSLKSITIPNGVTKLGYESFSFCKSLSQINLPQSLTTIDGNAFMDCDSLETVFIPKNVSTMGRTVFILCDSIKSVEVDEENISFKSVDGVLYSKDGKTLIYYPGGKTEISYAIIEGTEYIAQGAFSLNTRIANVSIPNTVKKIQRAFYECTAFESIVIPNSVTSINKFEFYGCTSLKSITLSNNVEIIPEYAFGECFSLESVVIPNGVKEINSYVFYKCTSLKSVVIPESVTVAEYDIFAHCTSLEKVYCEAESKPDSWDDDWARNVKEVIWGYKGE